MRQTRVEVALTVDVCTEDVVARLADGADDEVHVTQRRSERMFVALFSFVLAEQAHHPMQFLTTTGRSSPTSRRGPVRRTVRHLRRSALAARARSWDD